MPFVDTFFYLGYIAIRLLLCLRFHAIQTRTSRKPSDTLCREDGVLKRLVHEHMRGVAHFAQNRIETDIFLTFTLPQKIQLLMRVSFDAMSMRVHTSGDEEDASL